MAAPDDALNLRQLVESFFGSGTCPLQSNIARSNPVTGALSSPHYKTFTQNFRARLRRLARRYPTTNPNRASLLKTLGQVAGRNWQGHYAEIVAYDYFNHPRSGSPTFLIEPVSLDTNIDPIRTYSREMGKRGQANLDGHFAFEDVFFDVKAFKDDVKEILESIYAEVRAHPGRTNLRLQSEHRNSLHYDELNLRRAALVEEMVRAFDPERRDTYLRSDIIPEIRFQAAWEPGVLITMHDHDPHAYAQHYHGEIFKHTSKFVRDRPSFIVYVVFPWFNLLINNFGSFNKEFYRAFARRVFCQYRHSAELMKEKRGEFTGSQTVWEVSNDISAILFLEDKSILGNSHERTKVDAYWYYNPNANHGLLRGTFGKLLGTDLPSCVVESFEHDNY